MLNGDGNVINDSEQHDEYALGNTLFLLGSHNSMAGCEDEFGLMPTSPRTESRMCIF